MTIDPEPDRSEAAARPSPGWDSVEVTAILLNSLDKAIESIPGCDAGLHDFDNEDTGHWTWSTTRVKCMACGQTATLTYDPPPTTAPERDRTDHQLLLTSDQTAQALEDGRLGSERLVKMRTMPALVLWMAVRKAIERMDIGAETGALRRELAEARAERDSYLAQITAMPALDMLTAVHCKLDDLMTAAESIGVEGYPQLANRIHRDIEGLRQTLSHAATDGAAAEAAAHLHDDGPCGGRGRTHRSETRPTGRVEPNCGSDDAGA